MIDLSSLSKTYAKSDRKAVDNLSLSIPDGTIFGFLGPNGAGKTTTIRMLCGSLSPDSGRVGIDGVDMSADPLSAKRRIGFVNDNPELFNRLKGMEFLNFIGDVFAVPESERRARIEDLAGRLGIADVLASSIGSMSRGMKQKLCIVSSLLHDPWNWVLDEPMVGLDPQAAFELKELMRERTKAGRCVFFSTHVMEVAEKVCDRLAIINRGRILFSGSLDELRVLRNARDESLESLFLDLVGDEAGAER